MLVDLDGPDPRHPDARPLAVIARPLGRRTNNWAEWTAVVLALEKARALGASEVELVLDSKLVVEQLAGRWRVKERSLAPLHARARELLSTIGTWTVRHEGRASNRAADALANLALDDAAAAARAEAGGRWTASATGRAPAPSHTDPRRAPSLEAWMADYIAAWESDDASAIGALFVDEAVYRIGPSAEGWRGRDTIVTGWLERRDAPGGWSFRWESVGRLGELAVVRGWTHYEATDADFDNLWLIRFASDGRCSEFTEWWMEAVDHPA